MIALLGGGVSPVLLSFVRHQLELYPCFSLPKSLADKVRNIFQYMVQVLANPERPPPPRLPPPPAQYEPRRFVCTSVCLSDRPVVGH